MATVLDTSALVTLMRRGRTAELEVVAHAARGELEAGRALVSVITATELRVGARDEPAADRLQRLVDRLPVVAADRDIAELAGRMGAEARTAGAAIPLPDLFIAATAVWLDVPLLTCDSDFQRGVALGAESPAGAWGPLELHLASR